MLNIYLAELLTNQYDVDKETALKDANNLVKQWIVTPGIVEAV